ncbi:hypothetical protein [Bradyrhizobium sp.]|uniref:hypothetical protein n=1 Tax=Bradyrhizobium sp. TaxID=376 RepID=UPI00239F8846|nr:hypothetical protein [Bradyrhizobium sp.]MDE1936891.1 hypothetical protein [Bradyrhizobium sp.]
MSAIVISFVPRPRGRSPDHAPVPFRSPAQPDDLVMDHADTAPCEYSPWCDAGPVGPEPA